MGAWSKMSRAEERALAAQHSADERAAQGLPPTVEDRIVLAKVAAALRPAPVRSPVAS